MFEVIVNGVLQTKAQAGVSVTTITQDGNLTHIGGSTRQPSGSEVLDGLNAIAAAAHEISALGTVSYQAFLKRDAEQHVRLVGTEGLADQVDTWTWRVEGEVLVLEDTVRHPPRTDVRIAKYRRVSSDISAALPSGGGGTPNFTGVWRGQKTLEPNNKLALRISQNGAQVTISGGFWRSSPGPIDSLGKVTWVDDPGPKGRAPQFRKAGYSYDDPMMYTYTMILTGEIIVLTQEANWKAPCAQHFGTEIAIWRLTRSDP